MARNDRPYIASAICKVYEKDWQGSRICLPSESPLLDSRKMHVEKQPNRYVRRVFCEWIVGPRCRKYFNKNSHALQVKFNSYLETQQMSAKEVLVKYLGMQMDLISLQFLMPSQDSNKLQTKWKLILMYGIFKIPTPQKSLLTLLPPLLTYLSTISWQILLEEVVQMVLLVFGIPVKANSPLL